MSDVAFYGGLLPPLRWSLLLLPMVAWAIGAFWLKHRTGRLVVYLLAIGAWALLGLTLSRMTGRYLKADLDRYDLDGNGAFSKSELTLEARRAMQRFTSDTGRSYAPFTAGPIAFVWVSLNYGFFAVVLAGWRWMRRELIR